jgi:hypothetical protein
MTLQKCAPRFATVQPYPRTKALDRQSCSKAASTGLLQTSIFPKVANEVIQSVAPFEISNEFTRFGRFSFTPQIIVVDC